MEPLGDLGDVETHRAPIGRLLRLFGLVPGEVEEVNRADGVGSFLFGRRLRRQVEVNSVEDAWLRVGSKPEQHEVELCSRFQALHMFGQPILGFPIELEGRLYRLGLEQSLAFRAWSWLGRDRQRKQRRPGWKKAQSRKRLYIPSLSAKVPST